MSKESLLRKTDQRGLGRLTFLASFTVPVDPFRIDKVEQGLVGGLK